MRQDYLTMLRDTLDILERGSYRAGGRTVPLKLTRAQIEEAHVWLPDDLDRIRRMKDFPRGGFAGECAYACENADSFTLARRRMAQYRDDLTGIGAKPVLVLNLANPVSPGGRVRHGARAQEEDLCRKSSLLLSLESVNAAAYYRYNRSLNSYMGSDALVIHPQVEIIKDQDGSPLPETVIVAVMTCAAPILVYGLCGMTQAQYEDMMFGRIDGMLKATAYCGYRRLVLGAFGCGAFQNDAKVVSDLFRKALKDPGPDGDAFGSRFRSVDFAILDRSRNGYNLTEFSRNFPG